jgi:hypothetical protein
MSDSSPRLEEILERLKAPAERLRPDWEDVMARAGRARRRSAKIGALGAVCAIGLVSSAFAVVPHLLKPGPLAFMRSVKVPETGAPPAVRRAFSLHRFAGSPRRAARLRTGRQALTLWVSGHRGGGWCELLQRPRQRLDRYSVMCHWWKAEYGAFGGSYGGPELFIGRAAVSPGRRLLLRFTDGRFIRIPTNNGFYLFRVPERNLLRSAPRALVLADEDGEVARQRVPNPYSERLPIFMTAGLRRPGGVDLSRSSRVLARPTAVGTAALYAAPSRLRPATCSWLRIRRAAYGGGCVRDDRPSASLWTVAPLRLQVRGHEVQVLWGHVGSDFANVELRFQDGRRLRLHKRRGLFLYVVPRSKRARGHRPAILLGRDRRGKVLRKELLLTYVWAD